METWFIYALLSAVFAALTTIFAKIGLGKVGSNLATAIRTMAALGLAWIFVFSQGSMGQIGDISPRTWGLIVLSGLATGGAWLCRFKALKLQNVNKVTPITKTSVILTMVLAFIFLGDPLGPVTVLAMVLLGLGTWLMLELKKVEAEKGFTWLIFACLAALFASMVAILGSIGVQDINAILWTALRTIVVAAVSWLMVWITKEGKGLKTVGLKNYAVLILSGFATGGSWIFFYQALQVGPASLVVPVDQLSIVLTMGFAALFLKEKFTKRSVFGLGILTAGILLPIFV